MEVEKANAASATVNSAAEADGDGGGRDEAAGITDGHFVIPLNLYNLFILLTNNICSGSLLERPSFTDCWPVDSHSGLSFPKAFSATDG